METELRYSYGKDLDNYKTKMESRTNFDIDIKLPNGDLIQINTRKIGYALRFREKGKDRKTLRDIDY